MQYIRVFILLILGLNTLHLQGQNEPDTVYYYNASTFNNQSGINPIQSITQWEGQKIIITSYHRNGLKSAYTQRIGDTLVGKQLYWFESGIMRESSHYKNGKLNQKIQWYQTGSLKKEENYISVPNTWGKVRNLKHGKYIKNFRNGQTQARGTYDSGKQIGLWVMYYESGQIRSKVSYKAEKLNGKAAYWYESGQLKSIANYKVIPNPKPNVSLNRNYNMERQYWIQVREGKQVSYYENGKKQEESFYKNGKINGAHKKWFNTGQLIRLTEYHDGIIHGKNNTYFANGNPQQIITEKSEKSESESRYRRSKYYEGKYETYFQNGQVKLKAFYKNKKLAGKYISFYENGKKSRESNYKNGLLTGQSKSWFTNGRLKSVVGHKTTKIDGELRSVKDGVEITYGQNGIPTSKGFYKNGKKNGLWQTWHTNKQLKYEVSYCAGAPCKQMKQWDINGNLINEKKYAPSNGTYVISEEKKFENGRLKKHIFFDQKSRQSKSLQYFDNGKIMNLQYYLAQNNAFASNRISRRIAFYSNGNLRSDLFDLHQFIGVRLTYYFDGSPKSLSNYSASDPEDNFLIFWDPAGRMISFQKVLGKNQVIKDTKKAEKLYQLALQNATQKYQSVTGENFDISTNYSSLVEINKDANNAYDYIMKYWDGKPCIKMQFKDGVANGKFKLLSNKGVLLQTGDYKDGINSGLWIHFNKQGIKTGDYNYFSEDSIYTRRYFPNQKISEEYAQSKNYKSGPYKNYFESGQLKTEANYQFNRVNGTYNSYHENGKKSSTYSAFNGRKNGWSLNWYDNGQQQIKAFYTNNRIDSTYASWWKNGQSKSKGFYNSRGRKIRIWTFYKQNGQLLGAAEYSENGRLFGSHINNSCSCENSSDLELPSSAKPWQSFPYGSALHNTNRAFRIRSNSRQVMGIYYSKYNSIKEGNNTIHKFNFHLNQRTYIQSKNVRNDRNLIFNPCYSIFNKQLVLPATYTETADGKELTLLAKTVSLPFNKQLLIPLEKNTNKLLNISEIDRELTFSSIQINMDKVILRKDSIEIVNPTGLCFTPSQLGYYSHIKVSGSSVDFNLNYYNEGAIDYISPDELGKLALEDRFNYYTQRIRLADKMTQLGYEVKIEDALFTMPKLLFDTSGLKEDEVSFSGKLAIYTNGVCGAFQVFATPLSAGNFELNIDGKKSIIEIKSFIQSFKRMNKMDIEYSFNPSSKTLLFLFSK